MTNSDRDLFSEKDSRNVLVSLMVSILICVSGPTYSADTFSLDRAYEIALTNNERIQISAENIEQSRDELIRSRSQLLPQIDLSGQKSEQKELAQVIGAGPTASRQVFQHEKNHSYQFRLTQNLYHGGKNWHSYYRTKKRNKATERRQYRRVQRILFEVTRNYFQVLLAKRNLEIAQNSLERAKSQLKRAEAREEVGEISRTAVLRAQVTRAEARENVQRARNEIDVAYQRLGLSLGMSGRPGTVSKIDFRSMPDSSPEELYQIALRNRKDLENRRFLMKAARHRLKSEKADYYPNIDLVSEFSEQDKPAFSNATQDWRVQLVGSYPIFSGWKETAEISRAKSSLKSSRARIDRLKKEIKVEVKNAYLNLRTQRKVINTVRDQVKSARENYQQVVAEFEEGLSSSVDVNNAHTALREAENRLARARFSYQLDIIRLDVVLGVFQQNRILSWIS